MVAPCISWQGCLLIKTSSERTMILLVSPLVSLYVVFAGREQRTEFLVEMLTNKNIVRTDDDIISVPH